MFNCSWINCYTLKKLAWQWKLLLFRNWNNLKQKIKCNAQIKLNLYYIFLIIKHAVLELLELFCLEYFSIFVTKFLDKFPISYFQFIFLSIVLISCLNNSNKGHQWPNLYTTCSVRRLHARTLENRIFLRRNLLLGLNKWYIKLPVRPKFSSPKKK